MAKTETSLISRPISSAVEHCHSVSWPGFVSALLWFFCGDQGFLANLQLLCTEPDECWEVKPNIASKDRVSDVNSSSRMRTTP